MSQPVDAELGSTRPEPETLSEAAAGLDSSLRPPRRLDIVGHRNLYFAFSLLIIIPGIFFMVTQGFLLGIDFSGGTELEVTFDSRPTVAQVSSALAAQSLHGHRVEGSVQQAGPSDFFIRTTALANSTDSNHLVDSIASNLGTHATIKSASVVGGLVAHDTVTSALLAVLVASFLILCYLAFRFRNVPGGWRSGFQFGASALLALLHDVALLTGAFSILGQGFHLHLGEIDSLFLTAVLTVVGFSVHDTIVVFDRIRENLRVSQRLGFEQVVNLSIMQTAARSIITSFTVVIVLLSLFLFGGDTIKGFVLALLIGIVSGTYSSIFNAAPMLVVWRRMSGARR